MQPGTSGVSADPEAPLRYDAEGSPVFSDWDQAPPTNGHAGPDDDTRAAMEARVEAEKARLRAQVIDVDDEHPDLAEELPTLDEVSDWIKAADAKANGAPEPAKARRRDPRRVAPPPRKKEGTPVPKPPAVRDKRTRQIEDISDEQLLADAGVVPFYSTIEAAQFFDRTEQWMYWGLGRDAKKGTGPIFIYPDGTPIEPERVGDPETGRRRFTLPIIKEILLSSYRRGNIEPEELKKILRRIRINELGGEWREREGWHKIKGKWVHPSRCELVDGKWVKKQEADNEEEAAGE